LPEGDADVTKHTSFSEKHIKSPYTDISAASFKMGDSQTIKQTGTVAKHYFVFPSICLRALDSLRSIRT